MPAVHAISRARLLSVRLDRFSKQISGVDKGEAKALHRARVASRRLRELVPVLGLGADEASKLNRRLRKVTVRLGALRDLDVLLILIDELHASRPVLGDGLRRVRAGVARERDAARRRFLHHLPLDLMRRLAKKLDRIAATLDRQEDPRESRAAAHRTLTWAADARVASRAERLRAAISDAGAVYLPERLHAVRIAVKKLRYAVELQGEVRGQKAAAAVRTLSRVQTLLGRMHDLQVLIDRVREAQASLAPASLPVWRDLDGLVVALDDMCRRLHGRYVHEREALEGVIAGLVAGSPRPGRAVRRAG
jgi:CHAD domain-containing protein